MKNTAERVLVLAVLCWICVSCNPGARAQRLRKTHAEMDTLWMEWLDGMASGDGAPSLSDLGEAHGIDVSAYEIMPDWTNAWAPTNAVLLREASPTGKRRIVLYADGRIRMVKE
jgi:hypothetical protein